MTVAPIRSTAATLLLTVLSVLLASCGGGEGHGGGHGAKTEAHKPKGHGAGAASGHGSKPSSGGHGASSSSASHGSSGDGRSFTDASELLDLLEAGGQHDPSRFVEVEIGAFRITHKLADEQHTMLLKFRLFGIVSETKQAHLEEELPKFDKRIRDAVISLVQKTEAEQLAEPSLKWLKAELVAAINRVVQDRALSDVAFSDFSMEEV